MYLSKWLFGVVLCPWASLIRFCTMLIFSLFLVRNEVVFLHRLQFILPPSLPLFLFSSNALLIFFHIKHVPVICVLCCLLSTCCTIRVIPFSLFFGCRFKILYLCTFGPAIDPWSVKNYETRCRGKKCTYVCITQFLLADPGLNWATRIRLFSDFPLQLAATSIFYQLLVLTERSNFYRKILFNARSENKGTSMGQFHPGRAKLYPLRILEAA